MLELTPFVMEFIEEAVAIPQEYASYFSPPLKEHIHIPSKEPKVGDINLFFFQRLIVIRIGDHTELRTTDPANAVHFLKQVLTDQIVFYFHEGGVEHFEMEEFNNLSEADWNYFVWSGKFQYAFMQNQHKNRGAL